MQRILGLLTIAFFFPLALQAHMLKDDIENIVKKTKELYSKTTSAKITFSQSGSTGTATGRLEYSSGNKFRLTLPSQTIVSNGTKSWTYIKERNQVVINKAASGRQVTPNDILRSFPGDYSSTLDGSTTVNGKSCWIVQCTASDSSRVGDISSATLYIDKSTYRFRKITVNSASLGTMTLTITSANYNKTISSSRFTFTPPKGANIIDLTK